MPTVKAGDPVQIRITTDAVLTGAQAVSFWLGHFVPSYGLNSMTTALTKTLGDGVSIASPAGNAVIVVTLSGTDTEVLQGSYRYETRVVDAAGNSAHARIIASGSYLGELDFERRYASA